MKYILSSPTLMDSARLLGERLGMRVTSVPNNRDCPAPAIRWGNANGFFANDTIYNDSRAIYICSNKLNFSRHCVSNGIPTIEFHMGLPEKYPVVVRTLMNASEGRGIVICESEEQFLPYQRYYWSYYIPFEYELGVHILDGEVAKVFNKLRMKDLEEEKYPIRNSTRGYRFSLRSPEFIAENYPDLDRFVSMLYNTVAINMARLDIGWDAELGIFRVIEANSAPGLTANKNTAEMYVEFLKGKMESQ